MTTRELEQLQEKIKEAENNKIKYETKMEEVLKTLKEKYDIDDVKEAEVFLKKQNEKLEDLEEKKKDYEEKLDDLVGDFL